MNWYKIKKLSEIFIGDDYGPDDMIDMLETDAETPEQAVQILSRFNVPSQIITFPNADPIVRFADKVWEGGWIKDADQWVWDIQEWELDNYLEMPEGSFWDSVGSGSVVYHATQENNVESINANGLTADCQTRGISNRSMGCAVFASYNHEEIHSYGNSVYEINLGAMKADGFMPEVSGETPLEEAEHRNAIAHRIGLQDYDFSSEYSSDGLSPNTIAIYSDIPVKYITEYK